VIRRAHDGLPLNLAQPRPEITIEPLRICCSDDPKCQKSPLAPTDSHSMLRRGYYRHLGLVSLFRTSCISPPALSVSEMPMLHFCSSSSIHHRSDVLLLARSCCCCCPHCRRYSLSYRNACIMQYAAARTRRFCRRDCDHRVRSASSSLLSSLISRSIYY